MSKIYKLKKWYSLSDAAQRLTKTLREEVTEKELLQMAIEGHVPLSWYIRHIPAQHVIYETREISALGTVEGFFPVKDTIDLLEGPMTLEIDECGALKDYLLEHITGKNLDTYTLNGFFVSNDKSDIWKIVTERSKRFLEDNHIPLDTMLYNPKRYGPSGLFPELSDLGFQKQHIENLEQSLQKNKREGEPLTAKERSSHLNIIAALLHTFSGNNQAGAPNSRFNSEAMIIDYIQNHFSKKSSLSKRNLEAYFAEAKRNFKSD